MVYGIRCIYYYVYIHNLKYPRAREMTVYSFILFYDFEPFSSRIIIIILRVFKYARFHWTRCTAV